METDIKEKLKNCTSYSTSVDTWSLGNFHIISTFIYFIDDGMSQRNFLLDVVTIEGEETGKALSDILESSIKKYELDPKKHHIMMRDGASNMRKMGKELHVKSFDCILHKYDLVRFRIMIKPILGGKRSCKRNAQYCNSNK